jgi:molybdopterin adenylyltransferase
LKPKPIHIGILTISDRASSGEYEDRSGPAILALLRRYLTCDWEPVSRVVPDEQDQIESQLRKLADSRGCALVVTTGGTGPAPRDITPEATRAVCNRELPGFGEWMRAASLKEVPTAILSRQVAGTRGHTLIVNLPGKPQAIETCLSAVFPAIPYCVDLIGGPRLETDPDVMPVFRPGST